MRQERASTEDEHNFITIHITQSVVMYVRLRCFCFEYGLFS